MSVNGVDRDDLEPHKPCASRLDLIELARRKRRETVLAFPRRPGKDGWMGPVPPGIGQGPFCTISWGVSSSRCPSGPLLARPLRVGVTAPSVPSGGDTAVGRSRHRRTPRCMSPTTASNLLQVQDFRILLLDLAISICQSCLSLECTVPPILNLRLIARGSGGSTTPLGGGVGGCRGPLSVPGGGMTGGPLITDPLPALCRQQLCSWLDSRHWQAGKKPCCFSSCYTS